MCVCVRLLLLHCGVSFATCPTREMPISPRRREIGHRSESSTAADPTMKLPPATIARRALLPLPLLLSLPTQPAPAADTFDYVEGGVTKHSIIRQLDQPLVHSSRVGAAFAFGASRLTYGKKWHHVLNSLSADLTSASFSMLGEGSAFMEIGKRGVWSSSRVSTSCEAHIHLGVLAIDDELSNKPSFEG